MEYEHPSKEHIMDKDGNTYIFGQRERYPHLTRNSALLGAVIMTGVTIFFAWWTLRPIVASITSTHTETVEGTITKLRIKKLPRTTQLAPTQCVELEYIYVIEGREFTATRYRPTDTGPISGLITMELLENYHQGDSVTVYYNPEDVSDAVLMPATVEPGSIKPLIIIVIFTIILWVIFIKTP